MHLHITLPHLHHPHVKAVHQRRQDDPQLHVCQVDPDALPGPVRAEGDVQPAHLGCLPAVVVVVVKPALGQEGLRVREDGRVAVAAVGLRADHGAAGSPEGAYLRAACGDVARRGARNGGVDSQAFFDDGVEVGEVLEMLMGWDVGFGEVGEGLVELALEFLQDCRGEQEAPDDPGQGGGGGVGACENEARGFDVEGLDREGLAVVFSGVDHLLEHVLAAFFLGAFAVLSHHADALGERANAACLGVSHELERSPGDVLVEPTEMVPDRFDLERAVHVLNVCAAGAFPQHVEGAAEAKFADDVHGKIVKPVIKIAYLAF